MLRSSNIKFEVSDSIDYINDSYQNFGKIGHYILSTSRSQSNWWIETKVAFCRGCGNTNIERPNKTMALLTT